jgi:diaminohydroxyphosphoribosylaminopyrimidine deaminase/5-amino-6-(5-phosphoribosylamino)uracil reductase
MLFLISMDELKYMKRALSLARRARGRTSPNPMVGAVLVKNGRIIAADYHRRAGKPHAEALAIAKAGGAARGATLYVSLEPCCHTGKRTPPCTSAIIEAGIKRVVVAMKDPNPRVAGKGLRKLRSAGTDVSVGILEDEARALNEAYIKHITTGRPFVILKTAMTLDGKIATPTGQSKWITGEKSRRLVHRLRGSVDAIITAVGTVRADNPELTARVRGGKRPVRVVLDPLLKSPVDSRVFKCPPDTMVVTKTQGNKLKYLIKTGVGPILFKDKLQLKWLMKRLGSMGISSVLIEGGSSLSAHALMEGVVDKVFYFIAPKIIGGKGSYPAVGGKTYRPLEKALRLKNMKVRRVGEDILVEGYL